MQPAGEAATPLDDGLRLHLPGQPGRREVEDFIGGVYARRYGATIARFAPVLVSLHDAGGITAAAGYRSAGEGPLFLERYLHLPVDMALARHAARPPARPEIVEVGHLAAGKPGAGRQLMLQLGPHLAQRRFRWAVCTLTRELRQQGGLGALSLVKQAKALYENAIRIDGNALDGSAYNSLGVLYYKVPGWPVGFGDKAKARELLQKALAINPKGIDPNFFFGEYLVETRHAEDAVAYLERALQAPPRPGRELADQGRREEVRALLEKAKAR